MGRSTVKRVSKLTFKKCRQLNAAFAGSTRLRLHIDENEEEQTLVYDYYKGTFLTFMREQNNSPSSIEAKREVVWETGQAIKEMHDNGWMHVGN